MVKAQYEEEQFKNFGDFYIHCDVFNYHFESTEWRNGVALVQLAHNMMAIFNGHNNKAYFFSEGKVPEEWIKDQFDKCATKYACTPEVAKMIKDKAYKELQEIWEEKRKADY